MNDASRLLQMQAELASAAPCDVCQSWICTACGLDRTVRDDGLERRCGRCKTTQLGALRPVYHLGRRCSAKTR